MPKWLKITLAAVAAAAVVAGLIIWLVLWLTSGVVGTVERQLAAFKAGDMNAAYAETSEAFRTATPLEQFTAIVDRYPTLKTYADYSIPSRSIKNGVGRVSVTLTSPTGGVTPVDYQLVKENDVWKVLYVNVGGGG